MKCIMPFYLLIVPCDEVNPVLSTRGKRLGTAEHCDEHHRATVAVVFCALEPLRDPLNASGASIAELAFFRP